ncbi:MAG: hypothetical protein ACRYF2_04580 [Janthinobacterium lividum]
MTACVGHALWPGIPKMDRWGQFEHAALSADAIRLILAQRTALLSSGRKR